MYGLKRVKNRRQDALARTDWAEVERLVAEHYRQAGYDVEHCGTGGSATRFDGGIDLKLRRGKEFIVVQCKHWNAMKVPHNDVHQLIGLMVNEGASGAVLITSGEFTRAAIEAATKQGHVRLIDGEVLREMLGVFPESAPHQQSRFASLASEEFGQTAKRAAGYAGERLLSAAEDRIRGHGGGSARKTVGLTTKLLAFKAITGVVLPILVALAFMAWVKHVFRAEYLMPKAPLATSSAESQRRVARPAPAQASSPQTVVPVAPPYSIHQPTPEEIREQQRKAEEAIKVLEATTPELYQGRPGQVRGQ